MNNLKMDYGKKYHYIIKYMFMAIPLLLLILCYLFPTKSINNTYALSDESIITSEIDNYSESDFYYLSDEVYSSGNIYVPYIDRAGTYKINSYKPLSRITFNNTATLVTIAYQIDLGKLCDFILEFSDIIITDNTDITNFNKIVCTDQHFYIYLNDTLVYDFTISSNLRVNTSSYPQFVLVTIYGRGINSSSNGFVMPVLYDTSAYVVDGTSEINTTIYNSYDSSSLVDIEEVKQPNLKYIKPLNDFYKLNINSWYDTLLVGLHLNLDDDIVYYLYHIPLYLLYLYMFDLLLDIFGAIFRIAHRFIIKFGGDY